MNGTFQSLFRLKDASGHYQPFSLQGKLVNEKGGSLLLYLFLFPLDGATLRSVEQKEEGERQSLLFNQILSTTKTAIFWKDAQWRFLGANTAFLDYYGFPTEAAILGKNDEDMGWHSDPNPYKNDELRVLKEGISTFRVPGKCFAKGEERNIVASKSPLIVGGKIIGLVGSFEDVTLETRQKEEIAKLNVELPRRVHEHERLMATSAVAIATIHLPDLSLLEANDTVYEMLGLSRNEAQAQYPHSLKEFFAGERGQELDRFLLEARSAIEQKKPSFSFTFHLPRKKDSLWVSGAASFSAEDQSDVVVVYRDATDIMETQRRLSLAENEAKKVPTLSEENARLNSMIDGVPSGLGTLQIIDGVPADQIQLNQFFFSRVDAPSAKDGFLSVSAFLECLHPEDRDNFALAYRNPLRDKHLLAKQFRFRSRTNGAYLGPASAR